MSRRGKHRKSDVTPENQAATEEAVSKHLDASKTLRDAHARSDEVASLVGALRRIRARNHFGEMVREALDGG